MVLMVGPWSPLPAAQAGAFYIPFLKFPIFQSLWIYVPVIFCFIIAVGNSVNIADGMDGLVTRLCAAALCAAAAAFTLKQYTQALSPAVAGSIVLTLFGVVYFAAAVALKIPETAYFTGAVRARMRF